MNSSPEFVGNRKMASLIPCGLVALECGGMRGKGEEAVGSKGGCRGVVCALGSEEGEFMIMGELGCGKFRGRGRP
jgi:hypothetical protein